MSGWVRVDASVRSDLRVSMCGSRERYTLPSGQYAVKVVVLILYTHASVNRAHHGLHLDKPLRTVHGGHVQPLPATPAAAHRAGLYPALSHPYRFVSIAWLLPVVVFTAFLPLAN